MEEKSEWQNSTLAMLPRNDTATKLYIVNRSLLLLIKVNTVRYIVCTVHCAFLVKLALNSSHSLVFAERITFHPQISLKNEVFVGVIVAATALVNWMANVITMSTTFSVCLHYYLPLSKIGQMKIACTFDLIQRLTGGKNPVSLFIAIHFVHLWKPMFLSFLFLSFIL